MPPLSGTASGENGTMARNRMAPQMCCGYRRMRLARIFAPFEYPTATSGSIQVVFASRVFDEAGEFLGASGEIVEIEYTF